MLQLFYRKLTDIFVRLWDTLRWLPKRIFRLFRHFWYGVLFFLPRARHWEAGFSIKSIGATFIHWLVEVFFYLMDIFGVPEIYETLIDFIKFKTRPLSRMEELLARSIFGDTVNYRRVRIDESSYGGPKQHRFAYVSFFTINSWGMMNDSLFIHEFTHIWQFQQMGGVYIPRALQAQFSKAGYNYGGVSELNRFIEQGLQLQDFNLEQQADVVSDYHRLRTGYVPHWGNAMPNDLPVYAYFVDPIKGKRV